MTALADPPRPTIDLIRVPRIAGGEPATTELMIQWEPAFGHLPPILTIAGGWTGSWAQGGWSEWDVYRVRESESESGIRRFRLERDPKKLLHLPPGGDRSPEYEACVVARSGGGWCGCRGFQFGNDERRHCKHLSALLHLVQTGAIDQTQPEESAHVEGQPGGSEPPEPASIGGDWQEDRRHPGWL